MAHRNRCFTWVYLLKMVIFHGYVKYPEGIRKSFLKFGPRQRSEGFPWRFSQKKQQGGFVRQIIELKNGGN